jgi:hypothetical protein
MVGAAPVVGNGLSGDRGIQLSPNVVAGDYLRYLPGVVRDPFCRGVLRFSPLSLYLMEWNAIRAHRASSVVCRSNWKGGDAVPLRSAKNVLPSCLLRFRAFSFY